MRPIRCRLALLACAALPACGDSGVGTGRPPDLSGNWYFVDPSAPAPSGEMSEVGAALRAVNGQIIGNATVALAAHDGRCGSYGLDLPLTGTVDDRGHLVLHATDNADTLSISGTSDVARMSGTYTAVGVEAYPQIASSDVACARAGGTLTGVKMQPVNATYVGTLTNSGGAVVNVRLETHQDTIPVEGGWFNPHAANPALITRGHLTFLVGGFFVTGTMQITDAVCGVTTARIQPKTGYVWGTVLQIEFDTDTTWRRGATFATYIDPTSGSLNVVDANIYNETQSPICVLSELTGTLIRQ